jgi:hypothetical protein
MHQEFLSDGDGKGGFGWHFVSGFLIPKPTGNGAQRLLGVLARGVHVLRRRRRILVTDEEGNAGEVVRAVRELPRAAVPEVVGTDAIDLPRGELAGFVGAARGLEKLRTQIVHAEDEADVGTRSLERVACSFGEREPALVADFVDLARDREVGRARSKRGGSWG